MRAGSSTLGGKHRLGYSHSAVRAFCMGLHGTRRTPAHLPQAPTAVPRITVGSFCTTEEILCYQEEKKGRRGEEARRREKKEKGEKKQKF